MERRKWKPFTSAALNQQQQLCMNTECKHHPLLPPSALHYSIYLGASRKQETLGRREREKKGFVGTSKYNTDVYIPPETSGHVLEGHHKESALLQLHGWLLLQHLNNVP